MTAYWDDWGYLFSKIESGEKIDTRKFVNALHILFCELHEFDHKSKDGHTLDVFLRKNKQLEKLLEELGADEHIYGKKYTQE